MTIIKMLLRTLCLLYETILSLLIIIVLHFSWFDEVSDSQRGQENFLGDWKLVGVLLSSTTVVWEYLHIVVLIILSEFIFLDIDFVLCRPTYLQKLPVNFIQNSKGGITKYQL